MSKIGPHVIKPTAAALAWSRRARIVKALDDTQPLRVAPDGAVRIYRRYFPDQSLTADPAAIARAIIDGLGGYRHPLLWCEIFNELVKEQTEDHITFQGEVAARLASAGLKTCGPSWATGAYERETWEAWRAAGWPGCGLIALHAYFGNQGFTIWHALRYRQYWQPGDPQIVVTEAGRDKVSGGLGGWKLDGISGDQYADELLRYGAELDHDDYVLGATVFSAGPTPDWAPFDTDEISDRMPASLPSSTAPILPIQPISRPEPTPTITPLEAPMPTDERDRYLADIWHRAGVPLNTDSAIYKYWRDELVRGRYLGRPEEPEHPSEDGRYVLEAFGAAILHARVGEWVVREGLPF